MLHFPFCNTHVDKSHDFVDEVGRWGIRLALVDGKPERLLETLHVPNRDLNTRLYTASSAPYWQCRCRRQQARYLLSAMRRGKSYLRSTNYSPTYHLCIYTDMCNSPVNRPVDPKQIAKTRISVQCNETREDLLKVDELQSNLSLMHINRHLQVDLDMIIDDFVSRRNRRLDLS